MLNQYISHKFHKKYKATLGAGFSLFFPPYRDILLTSPKILDFFVQEVVIDDIVVVLQIWDTAGQERFRSLGTSYFHGADICCLVYDVNNYESFQNIQSWHEYFLSQITEDQAEGFPFVVIGNKMDLPAEQRAVCLLIVSCCDIITDFLFFQGYL